MAIMANSEVTAIVPTERGGSCIRCHVPVRPGEGVLVGSNLAHAKHYEDRTENGSTTQETAR